MFVHPTALAVSLPQSGPPHRQLDAAAEHRILGAMHEAMREQMLTMVWASVAAENRCPIGM
jgi:hypothetical protein